MQYTGLRDSKGNKIYEGDIVLYDRNINDVTDKQKFNVVWQKDQYGLQELKHKYYIWDISWDYTEVIGNIYDNPELVV